MANKNRLPLLLLLLPLTAGAALAAGAADWHLQFVGVENYGTNDQSEYYTRRAYTGHHEQLFIGPGHADGDEPVVYTCSEPPRVINQGQRVTLTVSNIYMENVSFAYNADVDGHVNPPFGETWTIGSFKDEHGNMMGNNRSYSNEDARTERRLSYSFDEDYLYDVRNFSGEAPDGAEFAIVFATQCGETRWYYKYYRGAGRPTEHVDDEDEGGYGTHDTSGLRWWTGYEDEDEDERDGGYNGGNDGRGGYGSEFDEDYPQGHPGTYPDGAPWSTITPGAGTPGNYGTMGGGDMTGVVVGTVLGGGLAVGGGLAGAAAGAAGTPTGGPGPVPRPSDRYVRRDEDGTIVYTNPITGEKDYLPKDSDEQSLRDQVEHVLDNREYYEHSYNRHNQWKQQTHDDLQREIRERNAQYQRDLQRRAEQEQLLQQQRDKIEQLKDKYTAITDDDLRRELIKEGNKAGAEYWQHMSDSDYADANYHLAKTTKDVADVSMDVLAAGTGPAGRQIRDVYKATSEMAGTLSDAVAGDKDIAKAAVAGATRATITYVQYQTADMGGLAHLGSTTLGEGFKDGVTSLAEGKSAAEAGRDFVKGMGRGLKDYTVDTVANNAAKAGGELVSSDTAKNIVDSVGAAADDIGKMAGDNYLNGN